MGVKVKWILPKFLNFVIYLPSSRESNYRIAALTKFTLNRKPNLKQIFCLCITQEINLITYKFTPTCQQIFKSLQYTLQYYNYNNNTVFK